MSQTKTYLYLHIPNLPALLSPKRFPNSDHRPLVAVSDLSEQGHVRYVNSEAKALGVQTGLRVRDLHRWNGSLNVILEDPRSRAGIAQEITSILKSYTLRVYPKGPDHYLLDITETEHYWGGALRIAEKIERQLLEQWNLESGIGIGPTRTVARVAALSVGAPGQLYVSENRVSDFLRDQPIQLLPGIRPKMIARLERYRLRTIGDLAELPLEFLTTTFGVHQGIRVWQLAQGQDTLQLKVKKEICTLTRELSLPSNPVLLDHLENFATYLCSLVAKDLRRNNLSARRLNVRFSYSDGPSRGMNRALEISSDSETILTHTAQSLIQQLFLLKPTSLSTLSICVTRLRTVDPPDTINNSSKQESSEGPSKRVHQGFPHFPSGPGHSRRNLAVA